MRNNPKKRGNRQETSSNKRPFSERKKQMDHRSPKKNNLDTQEIAEATDDFVFGHHAVLETLKQGRGNKL